MSQVYDIPATPLSMADLIGLPKFDDEIISKPVGIYTFVDMKIPFYAARKHTLIGTTPERSRVFQILVDVHGGLQWINVEQNHVAFNENQK